MPLGIIAVREDVTTEQRERLDQELRAKVVAKAAELGEAHRIPSPTENFLTVGTTHRFTGKAKVLITLYLDPREPEKIGAYEGAVIDSVLGAGFSVTEMIVYVYTAHYWKGNMTPKAG